MEKNSLKYVRKEYPTNRPSETSLFFACSRTSMLQCLRSEMRNLKVDEMLVFPNGLVLTKEHELHPEDNMTDRTYRQRTVLTVRFGTVDKSYPLSNYRKTNRSFC